MRWRRWLRVSLGATCALLGTLAILGHGVAEPVHWFEWAFPGALALLGALLAVFVQWPRSSDLLCGICALVCLGAASFHAAGTWLAPFRCGCIQTEPFRDMGHGTYLVVLGLMSGVAFFAMRRESLREDLPRAGLGVGALLAIAVGSLVAASWRSPDASVAELAVQASPGMSGVTLRGRVAQRERRSSGLLPSQPPDNGEPESLLVVDLLVPEGVTEDSASGTLLAIDEQGHVALERSVEPLAGRSTYQFALPTMARHGSWVVIEVDGLPTIGGQIDWSQGRAGEHIGRVALEWELRSSDVVRGRAVDPTGLGLAGVRLMLTTAALKSRVSTALRRATAATQGHENAVTVTTCADGSFAARGMASGPVRVYSLDPRFERIPDSGPSSLAWTVEPAAFTGEFFDVRLARVYELVVSAMLEGNSSPSSLSSNVLVSAEVVRMPPFPGKSARSKPIIGGGPSAPVPVDEYPIARMLCMEAADWRMPDAVVGAVRLWCPGYRSGVVPAQWRPVGQSASLERTTLERLLPGATARVAVQLRRCPEFLEGCQVSLGVRDRGGVTRSSTALAHVVGNRAILPAELPAGEYRITSGLFEEPTTVRVPQNGVPGGSMVLCEATCRLIAGISIRVRRSDGQDVRSFGIDLSVAPTPLRGRIEGLVAPPRAESVSRGLIVLGVYRQHGERRYYLLNPPGAVRARVWSSGAGYVADDIPVELGQLAECTLTLPRPR